LPLHEPEARNKREPAKVGDSRGTQKETRKWFEGDNTPKELGKGGQTGGREIQSLFEVIPIFSRMPSTPKV